MRIAPRVAATFSLCLLVAGALAVSESHPHLLHAWWRGVGRRRGQHRRARDHNLSYSSGAAPAYVPPPDSMELRHVIVVMRHGDRAPISQSAGDFSVRPYNDFWLRQLPSPDEARRWDAAHPVSGPHQTVDETVAPYGMLTSRGAAQCRALGEEVRARLLSVAPGLLRRVSARSTNIRRTQQTAQSFLFGLLPGETRAGVPVLVRPWAEENLVPKLEECPRLQEAASRIKPGDADAALKRSLAALLGYPPDAVNVNQAREVLTCVLAHGSERGAQMLPPGVSVATVQQTLALNAREWGARFAPAQAPCHPARAAHCGCGGVLKFRPRGLHRRLGSASVGCCMRSMRSSLPWRAVRLRAG